MFVKINPALPNIPIMNRRTSVRTLKSIYLPILLFIPTLTSLIHVPTNNVQYRCKATVFSEALDRIHGQAEINSDAKCWLP